MDIPPRAGELVIPPRVGNWSSPRRRGSRASMLKPANERLGFPPSRERRRDNAQLQVAAQSVLNTSAAAATVSAMSCSLCAALTKPASYSAGAMYTPRSSRPWNSVLKRGAVGLHHLAVVLRQLGQQEEAEHAAFAVGAEGHARPARGGLPGRRPASASSPRALRRSRACATSRSVARPQAVATGLPDSVPAWYTGPERRELLHDGARAAEGRQRHAAADHLAEHREVGREARNAAARSGPARRPGRRESPSSPRRTPAARRAACTARGSGA